MAKLTLSPPWAIYYEKIKVLFEEDKEIKIYYNEDEHELILYVENNRKAQALDYLLPNEIDFGNVTLTLTVIPANTKLRGCPLKSSEYSIDTLFEIAFDNNEAFSYTKTISGVMSNPIIYVVFDKKVVQYFNDDLGDVNGLCSTLYQELAKEVFKDIDEGVFFCTDIKSKADKSNSTTITLPSYAYTATATATSSL